MTLGLATIEQVAAMPGAAGLQAVGNPLWVNFLIGGATQAIRTYCKQRLELSANVEYLDGKGRTDLVLEEMPAWVATTTVASPSNGVALPQATINVASTQGFHPGLGGNPTATPPTLAMQTGVSTYTTVTYTGATATSFTGCSGGTGTLSSAANQNAVWSPAVFIDNNGMGGQNPAGFPIGTMLVIGTQFMVPTDRGGRQSKAGLLRMIGGGLGVGGLGGGFGPGFGGGYATGKLAAYRQPGWPVGQRNIKVCYTSGYDPRYIPYDLQYACMMLVAQMVRIMPQGTDLSSENLGAYSYSILADAENPAMGSLRRSLTHYRDSTL